jgi:hypothetical protein
MTGVAINNRAKDSPLDGERAGLRRMSKDTAEQYIRRQATGRRPLQQQP